MKNIVIILACFLMASCEFSLNTESPQSKEEATAQIDSLLNNWHRAAATANLAAQDRIGGFAAQTVGDHDACKTLVCSTKFADMVCPRQ